MMLAVAVIDTCRDCRYLVKHIHLNGHPCSCGHVQVACKDDLYVSLDTIPHWCPLKYGALY